MKNLRKVLLCSVLGVYAENTALSQFRDLDIGACQEFLKSTRAAKGLFEGFGQDSQGHLPITSTVLNGIFTQNLPAAGQVATGFWKFNAAGKSYGSLPKSIVAAMLLKEPMNKVVTLFDKYQTNGGALSTSTGTDLSHNGLEVKCTYDSSGNIKSIDNVYFDGKLANAENTRVIPASMLADPLELYGVMKSPEWIESLFKHGLKATKDMNVNNIAGFALMDDGVSFASMTDTKKIGVNPTEFEPSYYHAATYVPYGVYDNNTNASAAFFADFEWNKKTAVQQPGLTEAVFKLTHKRGDATRTYTGDFSQDVSLDGPGKYDLDVTFYPAGQAPDVSGDPTLHKVTLPTSPVLKSGSTSTTQFTNISGSDVTMTGNSVSFKDLDLTDVGGEGGRRFPLLRMMSSLFRLNRPSGVSFDATQYRKCDFQHECLPVIPLDDGTVAGLPMHIALAVLTKQPTAHIEQLINEWKKNLSYKSVRFGAYDNAGTPVTVDELGTTDTDNVAYDPNTDTLYSYDGTATAGITIDDERYFTDQRLLTVNVDQGAQVIRVSGAQESTPTALVFNTSRHEFFTQGGKFYVKLQYAENGYNAGDKVEIAIQEANLWRLAIKPQEILNKNMRSALQSIGVGVPAATAATQNLNNFQIDSQYIYTYSSNGGGYWQYTSMSPQPGQDLTFDLSDIDQMHQGVQVVIGTDTTNGNVITFNKPIIWGDYTVQQGDSVLFFPSTEGQGAWDALYDAFTNQSGGGGGDAFKAFVEVSANANNYITAFDKLRFKRGESDYVDCTKDNTYLIPAGETVTVGGSLPATAVKPTIDTKASGYAGLAVSTNGSTVDYYYDQSTHYLSPGAKWKQAYTAVEFADRLAKAQGQVPSFGAAAANAAEFFVYSDNGGQTIVEYFKNQASAVAYYSQDTVNRSIGRVRDGLPHVYSKNGQMYNIITANDVPMFGSSLSVPTPASASTTMAWLRDGEEYYQATST